MGHRMRFGPVLLCLVVTGGIGCAARYDQQELSELFARAETLCRDQSWDEAQETLKTYLLEDPAHPGAHYYLARTYLVAKDFRPAVAEGELQTALRLFVQNGRVSPIERFSNEYFEMICNFDAANVLLWQMDELHAYGAPYAAMGPLLARAEAYANEAYRIMPQAKEVLKIRGLLRVVRRAAVEEVVAARTE